MVALPGFRPDRVDYDQITGFEIAVDYFDVIAVVETPGDTHRTQFARAIDPYSAPPPAVTDVGGG